MRNRIHHNHEIVLFFRDVITSYSIHYTKLYDKRIELKIKLIEYSQLIEVRNKDKNDSTTVIEGKTIWRSNMNPINEDISYNFV